MRKLDTKLKITDMSLASNQDWIQKVGSKQKANLKMENELKIHIEKVKQMAIELVIFITR